MFADNILIGLDIGSDSVKMVELKHDKNTTELLTYGTAKHSLVLEGYWDRSKLKQVAKIIEEVMDAGDFTGSKVVISVPSKDVYVTTMDFELAWDKKQIENEIEKQAPYFLPYPPDEMRLSWTLIENDPRIRAYTGKQRVIINALPDFVIENSKNLLEHINLDGVALENQTISQIRSCLTPDQGNTVLVDIGSKQTTFSIVIDGVLRSSSHIFVGGHQISDEISKLLGVEDEIADNFKKDIGLVNLYDLPKPVISFLEVIRSELQTFVELNRRIIQDPHKIIFTGGGIYSAGLIETFRKFPIPVYFSNPFRRVKVNREYLPYISPIAGQLSSVIGLALRTDL